MPAGEKVNLRDYKNLIETIAKVEYQKFSVSHLVEFPELINIGNHTLYILFKANPPEHYNNTYLSTAIKWAIRNEVRRRYKWYSLKNRRQRAEAEAESDSQEVRCEVYKTILSIDEMQDSEVPTQIKAEEKTPDEAVEFLELKAEIVEAIKRLPKRERELIEYKFFKEKKLREISEEFDISQSRISRIIQAGLDKVKKDLKKRGVI